MDQGAARILGSGAHEVLFLPAYSPFLNPIENCFSVFKLKVRATLPEEAVVHRLAEIPAGVSGAEHRLVLFEEARTILDDQQTIDGDKVANVHMCWDTCIGVRRWLTSLSATFFEIE